jgi:hypothetical protein
MQKVLTIRWIHPCSTTRLPGLNTSASVYIFWSQVSILCRTPWEGDRTFAKSLPTKHRTQKTCRPIHALHGFRTKNPIVSTRRYYLGLRLSDDHHYITVSATRIAIATNYEYTQSWVLLVSCTPLCFNVPCQFTLLNLRSHVFGLTTFRWLGFIMRTVTPPPPPNGECHF